MFDSKCVILRPERSQETNRPLEYHANSFDKKVETFPFTISLTDHAFFVSQVEEHKDLPKEDLS